MGLILGDLESSLFKDKLSAGWGNCLSGDEASFRIVSLFPRIIKEASERLKADINIIDIGPNFGAINRATLIGADFVVVPMAADLFSLQGLKNLGNRLDTCHSEWTDRSSRNPEPSLILPKGSMIPLGYIVMQHGIKESRPVRSYLAWANRIPQVFRQFVLKESCSADVPFDKDEYCLSLLKYYSLVPMALEARKSIFLLKPADGAIGGHLGAVKDAYDDFKNLVIKIISLI